MNPLTIVTRRRPPRCPACEQPMVPAERAGERRHPDVAMRIGNPVPSVHSVPVWRCTDCALDHARFE